MPRFTVVAATLLRPSYPALVAAIRRQTFRDFQFVARADPGNEYIARNRAAAQASGDWLVFVDDDSVPPPDHLAKLNRVLAEHPKLVAVSGSIRGNLQGRGVIVIDQPGWWVGANMAVRRDVFLERPFEERWGLERTPPGWRADSDLGFSIEQRYPGRWRHEGTLVVDHPGPMGSTWQPDVEAVFFGRWRQQYLERFVPVDYRGQQFLFETQDLTPAERTHILKCREALRRSMPDLPRLPQEG